MNAPAPFCPPASIDELEERAEMALKYAKDHGFRCVTLLLEGRSLVSRFRQRPGVGSEEIEQFLHNVDKLLLGEKDS